MPKLLKRAMADEVKAELDAAPNLLVVGLGAMSADANFELRRRLRTLGARLRVIHNRTSRHALDERRRGLAEFFRGQTALALVPGEEPDMVSVAKALLDAARAKQVELRGGFVDGELLDGKGVELLARSPDKPTLRAMLLGVTLGPARGLAVAIQAVGGGLARCLQARIDQAEEATGGAGGPAAAADET